MKTFIATDGACSGNPGPGGWGWVTDDGMQNYGGEPFTTNQRMELMAAARGLLALFRSSDHRSLTSIIVISDSRYVIDGMTKQWYRGWERRDWKTVSGAPVKHRRLWETLIRIVRAFEQRNVTVEWQWVKGHRGHPLNELADDLAVLARDEQR